MGMCASFYRVSKSMLDTIMLYVDNLDEIIYESEQLQEVELDIDKSWHGIYFLLTGDDSLDSVHHTIVGQAILVGEEIGEDLGYGPLRYLAPSKVFEINQELINISVDEFESRFDLKKLNNEDVYPGDGNWNREDKEYLVEY